MFEVIIEREMQLSNHHRTGDGKPHDIELRHDREKEIEPAQISIKVYVDHENKKLYVDLFAASSMGILPIETVERYYDSGLILCEISEEKLLEISSRFEGRIDYVDLKELKDEKFVNIPKTNSDKFDFKEENELGNYIKYCFDNYKKDEKFDNFSNYLEQVENLHLDQNEKVTL